MLRGRSSLPRWVARIGYRHDGDRLVPVWLAADGATAYRDCAQRYPDERAALRALLCELEAFCQDRPYGHGAGLAFEFNADAEIYDR